MPLLLPIIAGLFAGGLFAHRRPTEARRMVNALDRSGATVVLNAVTIAALPARHPMAMAFKLAS
jgi:hypothetical protein